MSTIRANNILDAAGGNTATINGMTPTGLSLQGFRNRIINGGMVIDQRNAGASVTASSAASVFCPDRFNTNVGGSSAAYSCQQVTDAPAGFTNSLRLTVTTAATLSAAQFTFTRQIIEGFNISDLAWGTASAVPVTVSFWVKSSITGTYSGFLVNSAEDRSYVGTFTVNAANTWEQKSFTVPGDTTGTWLTNNGNGIRFGFDLGSGSNFQGTANAWNSGWRQRTSGTVNFCQNSGATFQITGVQLEAGSVATPFERRDYGRELIMCQRYYEKSYDINVVPGTNTNTGQFSSPGTGNGPFLYATSITFKVTKRATPTMAAWTYTGTSGSWHYGVFSQSEGVASVLFAIPSMTGVQAYMTSVPANQNAMYGQWAAISEL